jgi:protein-L-isoaspartate(D-aspartate) O-methyltransferase
MFYCYRMKKLVTALSYYLRSPIAKQAMEKTDRSLYCAPETIHEAYKDYPLPLGVEGATISAPHMHAYALDLLATKLYPGAKVLDVGSGSGYLVAALARIVGPEGFVVGVDIKPELIDMARNNIANDAKTSGDSFLTSNTEIHLSNGWEGDVRHAPYDVIHVGAAAHRIPQSLVDQLKIGGILVIPIGPQHGTQDFIRVEKLSNGQTQTTSLLSVRYVPLVESPPSLSSTTGKVDDGNGKII